MKKLFSSLLFAILFVSTAFAQQNMAPMQPLPAKIVQFVETNFKGVSIRYHKHDFDEIDVLLSNGAKLEFYPNGEWKDIECYQNFPTQILPLAAVQAITSQNAVILEAERKMNGYKIKASNGMKYYVTPDGHINYQKFDD